MKTKIILAAAIVTAVTGCATHKMGSVVPQPGGIYQAIGNGYTNGESLNMALYSAETTCKNSQKRHVVKDQKTAYKGVFSENTNQLVERVTSIFSSKNDYTTYLDFTCEA